MNLKHQTFREFAKVARKVYEVVGLMTTASQHSQALWSKNNNIRWSTYSSRKGTSNAHVVDYKKRQDPFKGGNSGKKSCDDYSLEFLYSFDETIDLYQQLVTDGIVTPPPPRTNPTDKDKTNPKFCIFHQYIGHPTRDCHTLKKIINEHHSDGTPILKKK